MLASRGRRTPTGGSDSRVRACPGWLTGPAGPGPRMALTPVQEQAITGIRIAQGWGPDRIALVLRLPRATVHRAIVRLGLRRTRVPAPPVARYERAGPGDLVHIDTKKLGRIIGGLGHRVTGDRRSRSRGAGWTVIHAAIDDATRVARVAYVELLPDECGETASGFLRRMDAHFRRLGIPVQRVLTDNGSQYVPEHGRRRARTWVWVPAGPGRTGPRRTGRSSAGSRPSCANACTSTRWPAETSVNVHWTRSWSTTTMTDRTSASKASPPSPASPPCQQPCERQHLGAGRVD